MSERPKRKRLRIHEKKINRLPAIEDEFEFKENKGSKNARKISTQKEAIIVELWIDKHYQIRHQHGDDFGKREGIEEKKVLEIVSESVQHLLVFSSITRFSFLNYDYTSDGRAIRVVCQKEYNGIKTNVVIVAHFIELRKIEITIVTAIQKNDFQLSDGQFAIELLGNQSSVLRHFARGTLSELSNIY